MTRRPVFTNDYSVTAHPAVLAEITSLNTRTFAGYGMDELCSQAESRILELCDAPSGCVRFIVGGTQVNDIAIDSFLRPWQSVLCATTGHIATHEAGAIENSGHSIQLLASHDGLLDPSEVEDFILQWRDGGMREHLAEPGLVCISQPTELGTLYSLERLEALSEVCHAHGLVLYIDGARMGYGLGATTNDVTLKDIARLSDAFTIGGTKCGALGAEALVLPRHEDCEHLRPLMKIHGGLLAKGWLLGAQFLALLRRGDYFTATREATSRAQRIRRAFEEAGFEMLVDSPTNQIFPILPLDVWEDLSSRFELLEWERLSPDRVCARVVVSWSTTKEDEAAILEWIAKVSK